MEVKQRNQRPGGKRKSKWNQAAYVQFQNLLIFSMNVRLSDVCKYHQNILHYLELYSIVFQKLNSVLLSLSSQVTTSYNGLVCYHQFKFVTPICYRYYQLVTASISHFVTASLLPLNCNSQHTIAKTNSNTSLAIHNKSLFLAH